ncbi:hypothetical protein OS493_034750 [Desmophyllum pertusum]|uniref:UPAR/Ly6 domain-containing protein n=1 Tax=Desmophyllum pertusum TaxID=174260 RepID=A0A9X0CQ19_9CNID|nr:hypothetical protein OS493_034750 [Desmophyllum pertusum]
MCKFILFTLSFVVICTSVAQGFTPKECYECFTHASWEDCVNKTIVQDCGLGDDMCIKGKMTFTKNSRADQIFFKTCANENECTTYEKDGAQAPTCLDKKRQGYSVDCFVTCCEDDLCNSAVHGQVVSVLLLLLPCAQAAFHE